MKTNHEIVEEIARSGMLANIINKITDNGKGAKDPDSLPDLQQDLFLSFLTDLKLPKIYEEGHLSYYLARCVMNNILSSSSPYYRTYLKPLVQQYGFIEGYKRQDLEYGDEGNEQN